MQTTDNRAPQLVELGSVTADTRGQGGVILEGFTLMPKAGITDE
jgi:hypothetical protein